MTLDSFSAGDLDHLDAVIASIDAGSHVEGTTEQTVLQSFGAVVKGRARLSHLAVDAEGGAESPTAGVAVEAGKAARFDCVPLVDAAGDVAGAAREPIALTTLFEKITHQLKQIIFILSLYHIQLVQVIIFFRPSFFSSFLLPHH